MRGTRFDINICNDLNYAQPASAVALAGARLLVCPANNMMRREVVEAWKTRHNSVRAEWARQTGMWLLSSAVTGQRDDRVSYGPTAVIDPDGCIRRQLPLLTSGILIFDMN